MQVTRRVPLVQRWVRLALPWLVVSGGSGCFATHYGTNGDVEDLSTPLSHAALIKRHIEGDWPSGGDAP